MIHGFAAVPAKLSPAHPDLVSSFRKHGAVVVSGVVELGLTEEVRGRLPHVPRAGIRNAVRVVPGCVRIAEADAVRAVVRAILGDGAFVTRSILFDKSPDANWAVAYDGIGRCCAGAPVVVTFGVSNAPVAPTVGNRRLCTTAEAVAYERGRPLKRPWVGAGRVKSSDAIVRDGVHVRWS